MSVLISQFDVEIHFVYQTCYNSSLVQPLLGQSGNALENGCGGNCYTVFSRKVVGESQCYRECFTIILLVHTLQEVRTQFCFSKFEALNTAIFGKISEELHNVQDFSEFFLCSGIAESSSQNSVLLFLNIGPLSQHRHWPTVPVSALANGPALALVQWPSVSTGPVSPDLLNWPNRLVTTMAQIQSKLALSKSTLLTTKGILQIPSSLPFLVHMTVFGNHI